MKHFKISLIMFCVILSLSNVSLSQSKSQKNKIKTFPIKNESGCPLTYVSRFYREKPSSFSGKVAYWFKGMFRSNFVQIPHYKCFPVIEEMNLSDTVLYANCEVQDSDCSNKSRRINVSVKATDSENAVLLYHYKITGGTIIGEGPKVIWDLSRTPVGTYAITVCADDTRGCEANGETNKLTKEVKIIRNSKEK